MEALVPLTGRRWQWVRDGAVLGGIAGGVPAALALGATASTGVWIGAAAAASLGAVLGAMAPWALKRLRQRTSIEVIAAGVPLATFVLAIPVAWGVAVVVGAPVAEAVLLGSLAAGVPAALFFLPYLMATVLGRRRWPILVGTVAVSAVLGAAARLVVLGTLSPVAAVLLLAVFPLGGTAVAFLLSRWRAPAPRSSVRSPSLPYSPTPPR
ncbi:MAG: hypothetical protein KTR31_20820 [Myxococcales bacterium]|nr:hypothetical protein [Myxococcales bacterium]